MAQINQTIHDSKNLNDSNDSKNPPLNTFKVLKLKYTTQIKKY